MESDQFAVEIVVMLLSFLGSVWWLSRRIGEKSDYIVRQVERIETRQYHQLAGIPETAPIEEDN
ncbi:MAG: hypothetical protein OXT05_06555 [Chloroflexota bacterium]|nr:hypothetical protein [Chloroflexota bacterium]